MIANSSSPIHLNYVVDMQLMSRELKHDIIALTAHTFAAAFR